LWQNFLFLLLFSKDCFVAQESLLMRADVFINFERLS
jgi:hypothetical protein